MDHEPSVFGDRRPLSCSEIEELLDSYIDEEMAAPMVCRFEQHLSHCEECRALVTDCEQIVFAAKSLAEESIPQDVSLRLRESLREQVGNNVVRKPPKLVLVKPD